MPTAAEWDWFYNSFLPPIAIASTRTKSCRKSAGQISPAAAKWQSEPKPLYATVSLGK